MDQMWMESKQKEVDGDSCISMNEDSIVGYIASVTCTHGLVTQLIDIGDVGNGLETDKL